MKALFIGGLADGITEDVRDLPEKYSIPVSDKEGSMQVDKYFLDKFATGTKTWYMYRHINLTPDEAVDRLFDGYNRMC